MIITCDYEGSSINVVSSSNEKREMVLCPKSEYYKKSFYYNFVADNTTDNRQWTIIINGLRNPQLPIYYRNAEIGDDKWRYMDDGSYVKNNNSVYLNIPSKRKIEISASPRYIDKDFDLYLSKKQNLINSVDIPFVRRKDTPTEEVLIGSESNPVVVFIARQHPGETLSSFFLEGIMDFLLGSECNKEKQSFLIFPFCNKVGVEKGHHRRTDGVDFNREWGNKNAPVEIQYIRNRLLGLSIKCLVDIHNDENTSFDYIRTESAYGTIIAGMQVLGDPPFWKRFVKSILKNGKFISPKAQTAREYVRANHNSDSILVELSMLKGLKDVYEKGGLFASNLMCLL